MNSFPHSVQNRGAQGFTLVEVLVTVAILGILAALSLGAYSQMIDRSHLTTDSAKLRQIGTAISLYAGDNNMTLPNSHQAIPGTATSDDGPNRWTFHEAVDRYLGTRPPEYNPRSVYNFRKRVDSPFYSRAIEAYPGFEPGSPQEYSPLAFSYNPNLNHTNWQGKVARIPNAANIVIVGETNHKGGQMNPHLPATFENNVESRYRISRPGERALYLFADFHIETLEGERGYEFYDSSNEPNIWRWW